MQNAKYFLVTASTIWGLAACVCFFKYVLDCYSDRNCNLKTLPWAITWARYFLTSYGVALDSMTPISSWQSYMYIEEGNKTVKRL